MSKIKYPLRKVKKGYDPNLSDPEYRKYLRDSDPDNYDVRLDDPSFRKSVGLGGLDAKSNSSFEDNDKEYRGRTWEGRTVGENIRTWTGFGPTAEEEMHHEYYKKKRNRK